MFDLDKAKRIFPESLLCDKSKLPKNRPPRLIGAMAFSPTLQASFSGITYHLAQAGLETQKLEGCFSLYSGAKPPRGVQVRGAIWKLARLLQGQKTGGFKFTGEYQDEVWPRYIQALAGATVVSNFQLYGSEFIKRREALDIGAYFYIDGTLAEYFEEYADFEVAAIDAVTRKKAIAVEQESYDSADGIVVMSKLAAKALQERYKVPKEKISIVVPGASLMDEYLDGITAPPQPAETDEFVLGFVGLYPVRKGLDRLAEAVRILRGRGLPVKLRVIGKCPDNLLQMDGLEFLGVINKKTNLAAFVQAVGSVHLGCLVSRSELAGIAILEFLRLGVPVLGTRVGGATDILEGGGSIIVSPDVGGEELAETIAGLYHDREKYLALRREAEARSQWASWRRVTEELDAVLP